MGFCTPAGTHPTSILITWFHKIILTWKFILIKVMKPCFECMWQKFSEWIRICKSVGMFRSNGSAPDLSNSDNLIKIVYYYYSFWFTVSLKNSSANKFSADRNETYFHPRGLAEDSWDEWFPRIFLLAFSPSGDFFLLCFSAAADDQIIVSAPLGISFPLLHYYHISWKWVVASEEHQ